MVVADSELFSRHGSKKAAASIMKQSVYSCVVFFVGGGFCPREVGVCRRRGHGLDTGRRGRGGSGGRVLSNRVSAKQEDLCSRLS